MSFEFTCPHCGQKLEAETEWIGSKGECPYCKNQIIIKQSEDTENKTIFQSNTNLNVSSQKESFISLNNTNTRNNSKHFQDNKNSINFTKSKKNHVIISIIVSSMIILLSIACVYKIYLYNKQIDNKVDDVNISSSTKQTTQTNQITQTKNTISDKEETSLIISCFLYNDYNEKIIPFCKINIYESHMKAEQSFVYLLDANKNYIVMNENYKKIMKDTNNVFYDTKTQWDAQTLMIKTSKTMIDLLEAHGKLLEETPILVTKSFREGNIKITELPQGEYTLYAEAPYGTNTFYWLKHVKIQKSKITEIQLTNDDSCLLPMH